MRWGESQEAGEGRDHLVVWVRLGPVAVHVAEVSAIASQWEGVCSREWEGRRWATRTHQAFQFSWEDSREMGW